MKTFSAKSSAVRAAAAHFKVKRNMAEVLKVAIIKQNGMGEWVWTAIPKKIAKPEPKKVVKPEAVKSESSTDSAKKTWKRPGTGTKTGRVWELADKFQSRALVLEAAKQEGLNSGMASQQFFRWNRSTNEAI